MAMETEVLRSGEELTITNGVVETPGEVSLPRAAAAGSLVLSAALLMAGKRKSALAAAAMAGALVALESPEAVKRLWSSIPEYLRRGQDFLVRMEDVVGDISEQGQKLWDSLRAEAEED